MVSSVHWPPEKTAAGQICCVRVVSQHVVIPARYCWPFWLWQENPAMQSPLQEDALKAAWRSESAQDDPMLLEMTAGVPIDSSMFMADWKYCFWGRPEQVPCFCHS